MAHRFVADLHDGDVVRQCFLLRRFEARAYGEGRVRWDLELGDRTGSLKAVAWDDAIAKCPAPLTLGEPVAVKGQVTLYQNRLQLRVEFIASVADLQARGRDPGCDLELLVYATPFDRLTLWQELLQLADHHIKPPLHTLVLNLLHTYEPEFQTCPAARQNHHAYVGGLLEHTWSVARLALKALEVYPGLNQDLVLAGVILHDVGKLREFAKPAAPELTVAGGLVGHIALGWEMVRQAAREMAFPDETLLLELEHILIAHHGSLENGSPVPPRTPEALLVHELDDLDAKLKMMQDHLAQDRNPGPFTVKHWLLDRWLFKERSSWASMDAGGAEAEEN
jgi:3'-5' exoribonuclease